jgi:hypothetical protein
VTGQELRGQSGLADAGFSHDEYAAERAAQRLSELLVEGAGLRAPTDQRSLTTGRSAHSRTVRRIRTGGGELRTSVRTGTDVPRVLS